MSDTISVSSRKTSSSGQRRKKGNQILELGAPLLDDAHGYDAGRDLHRSNLSAACLNGDLAPIEEIEDLVVLAHLLHLDELKLLDHAVQTVLDGRVADAERLLHVLDGPVAAHELAHEHLVFVPQARQRRQFEIPDYGDITALQPDSRHDERTVSGQVGQIVPLAHIPTSMIEYLKPLCARN